jgi:DNA-binding NarL/FixJ family response regulator
MNPSTAPVYRALPNWPGRPAIVRRSGISGIRRCRLHCAHEREQTVHLGQDVCVPAISAKEIDKYFEVALASRVQQLERRLQAAILKALDATIGHQFRLLYAPADPEDTLKMRLLPARSPGAMLSRREQEVANRIARGLSNRQIAADLVIAISTTERHVANILNKLGMRSRSQVAAWAAQHALLQADDDPRSGNRTDCQVMRMAQP